MNPRQIHGAELIRRGARLGRQGDLERGVLCLLEGLAAIDERQSPRLALSAYHNLALFLAHLRMSVLARAVVVRARALYRQVGDPVMNARLTWLQGTLAELTGNPRLAGQKLREAIAMFEGLQMAEVADKVRDELAEAERKPRPAARAEK
jgi:hypothetical protein